MAFLVVAGIAAGTIGSAGGITSLVSYPALLAIGLNPFRANVANSVAVVACLPGSSLGSRPELRGQGSWLRSRSLIVAAGGFGGVALLVLTPRDAFTHVVPFLLVFSSLALLFQPRLVDASRSPFPEGRPLLLPVGLFVLSLYDGYFGAGAGVMVLVLLLFTVHEPLARLNALKNVLLGIADVLAALSKALLLPVHWAAVGPMAIGLFIGSTLGPRVTRVAPAALIRLLAASAGFGLAAYLIFMSRGS